MDAPSLTSSSANAENPSVEQSESIDPPEDAVMKHLLSMEASPSDLVKKLKDRAKELREARNKCKKDLRNAVRRNKRLRDRAKNLCDNDLIDILRMRATKKGEKDESAQEEERVDGAASASGSRTRTPSPSGSRSSSSNGNMETPQKKPRRNPSNREEDAEVSEK